MLTGDRADVTETIGAALDLDAVLANRVPSDKVGAVAREQRQHPTVMVGDVINDVPALAAAGIGSQWARGALVNRRRRQNFIAINAVNEASSVRTRIFVKLLSEPQRSFSLSKSCESGTSLSSSRRKPPQ